MVPPHPVAWGRESSYERPPIKYDWSHFKYYMVNKINNPEMQYKQQLAEQINLLTRKKRLAMEAHENMNRMEEVPIEEVMTDNISSEEIDIYERKRKFEELSKRMEQHRKDKFHLRGNDLRYQTYLIKMQKLARMDLGLDLEAYKDYVNNLKKFAEYNNDFEFFARDNLMSGDNRKERVLYESMMRDDPENEYAKYVKEMQDVCDMSEKIINSLGKLRRVKTGWLKDSDREYLDLLLAKPETYLAHTKIFTTAKTIYAKEKRKLFERKLDERLQPELITKVELKMAGMSEKRFEAVKRIL